MITSKYITPVIAVIMAIAVIFTGTAMFAQKTDTSGLKGIQKAYISQIFQKDSILNINIDMKQEDWDWIIENATKEEYRPCNITINGQTFYNVGIRPKGNSSLSQVARDSNTDRFSFKISFDEYVDGQNLYGLSSMALNNTMSDASYMKEYLSYDLMSSMGVPSPTFAYTDITINDKPWGLYLAVEIIDKSFLQRYYGIGDYNLYKPDSMDMAKGGEFSKMQEMQQNLKNDQADVRQIKPQQKDMQQNIGNAPGQPPDGEFKDAPSGQAGFGGAVRGAGKGASGGTNLKYIDDNPESYSAIRDSAVLKTTDDKDFGKVVTMIKGLDSGENLEEVLNVDEVLRYFAVNTFMVNLDSYSGGMYHNYYLFEENGIFSILPWDFNMSFAGFGIQDAGSAVNFPIDSPTTDSLENAPLIGKLLDVPEYKELYHKYLNQIVTSFVDNGKLEQSITKLDNLINSYVKKDATAFYTYNQYQKAVPEILQLIKDRAKSIKAQLSGEQPSTSYGNISTTVNLQNLGSMFGGGGKAFGNNQQGARQMPGVNNQQSAQQMPGVNNQQGAQQMPGGNSQQGSRQMPGGNNQQGAIPGDQPPQMNQGGLGQRPAGDVMFDKETMSKAFEILSSANGAELTEEQKSKLKELGLDETQINQMKDMTAKVPQGFMGGQPNGDFKGEKPNETGSFGAGTAQADKTEYVMILISAVLMICGILFCWKFKRKRYVKIRTT